MRDIRNANNAYFNAILILALERTLNLRTMKSKDPEIKLLRNRDIDVFKSAIARDYTQILTPKVLEENHSFINRNIALFIPFKNFFYAYLSTMISEEDIIFHLTRALFDEIKDKDRCLISEVVLQSYYPVSIEGYKVFLRNNKLLTALMMLHLHVSLGEIAEL